MTSLRNIVSILVLCAVLTITLGRLNQNSGHTNQNGAHYNQVRIRRQVAGEIGQENTTLQDQEDAVQQNKEQDDVVQKNVAQEDDGRENNEQENTVQENENAGLENEKEDVTTNTEDENFNKNTVEETTPALTYPFWTTCDFGIQPIKSCYDCNHLLICKRVGGLVKPCGNPFRPHCNNGTCSPLPSVECDLF